VQVCARSSFGTGDIRFALRYNLGDMEMKIKGGMEKTAEQNRL
jgi:hypothetical protein